MHRNGAAYYTQPNSGNSRGHATSSAFSASAHPHEDWTKISDLAERRRIQNRIAQRNYRKKLKKRLEDLEKRANTNSTSPDQRPSSLARQKLPKKKESVVPKAVAPPATVSRAPSEYSQPIRASEPPQIGFLPLQEDGLFSEQYRRHLSHSPSPQVDYPVVSADVFNYPTFTSQPPYAASSASCNDPAMYAYQSPFNSPYPTPLSTVEFPIKQELFSDVDSLNFNIGFPPLSGVELSQGLAFADRLPQTPPLSDCFEMHSPSPPESLALPQTPAAFPPSPPLTMI